MSGPSSRRAKKRQERKRRLRREAIARKERDHKARRRPPLPQLDVVNDGAPFELEKLVVEAIRGLRLDDPKIFAKHEIAFSRVHAAHGYDLALEGLRSELLRVGIPMNGIRFESVTPHMTVGDALFDRIGQANLARFIPFSDIQLLPRPQTWQVRLRSLRTQRSKHGTIYYSKYRPKLTVDGAERVVGFRAHAVHRICDRVVREWRSYGGLGDAFAYLYGCMYFEDTTLPDGQQAFTFYDHCLTGTVSEAYTREILEQERARPRQYYRVGYCPADVEGDFIVGRTLLPPGYGGTPERELLRCASLRRDERSRLLRRSKVGDKTELVKTGDLTALKWFHENGIPQVVELPGHIFREV